MIARATELALEQRDRLDGFKKHFHLDDPNTDVLREFYKDAFEAAVAFLISDYLVRAHAKKHPDKKTP